MTGESRRWPPSDNEYLILEPLFVVTFHPDRTVRVTAGTLDESGTILLSDHDALRMARAIVNAFDSRADA